MLWYFPEFQMDKFEYKKYQTPPIAKAIPEMP